MIALAFSRYGPELKVLFGVLEGSWDLVSMVISTLTGVISIISIVTLIITLVAKSHDPLSMPPFLTGYSSGFPGRAFRCSLGFVRFVAQLELPLNLQVDSLD